MAIGESNAENLLNFCFPSTLKSLKMPLQVRTQIMNFTPSNTYLVEAGDRTRKTLNVIIPLYNLMVNSKNSKTAKSKNEATNDGSKESYKVLVVAPCNKICSEIHNLISLFSYEANDLYGVKIIVTRAEESGSIEDEKKNYSRSDVLIGTPGILQKSIENGTLDSARVRIVVAEEIGLFDFYSCHKSLKNLLSKVQKAETLIFSSKKLTEKLLKSTRRLVKKSFGNREIDILGEIVSGSDNENGDKVESGSEKERKTKLQFYKQEISNTSEKCLVMYSLFKFGIVKGKTVIVTENTESAYFVKVFLAKVSISSLVFNEKHPKVFSSVVVKKFQKGVTNILIMSVDNALVMCRKLDFKILVFHDLNSEISNYKKIIKKINSQDSVVLALFDKNGEKIQKTHKKMRKSYKFELLGLKINDLAAFKYRIENIAASVCKKIVKDEPYLEISLEQRLRTHKEILGFVKNNIKTFKSLPPRSRKFKEYIDDVPFYLMPKISQLKIASTKNFQTSQYFDRVAIKRKNKVQGNKNKRRKFKRKPRGKK